MPICGLEISMQSVNSMSQQYAPYSEHKDLALLNCGILAFAITIVIPLSMGLTRLPFIISCPVFASGFISLFWLALHQDRKNAHPKRSKVNNFEDSANYNRKSTDLKETKSEECHPENEVPFELVRANMRKMLLSHGDYIDDATKNKLIDLCNKLEKI